MAYSVPTNIGYILKDLIIKYASDNNLTLSKVASIIGMSQPAMSRMMANQNDIIFGRLLNILSILGVSFSDIQDKIIVYNDPQEVPNESNE